MAEIRNIIKYNLSYANQYGNVGALVTSTALLTSRSIEPNSLCVDSADNTYMSDAWNAAIYRVTESGNVFLYAGTPGTLGDNGADEVDALSAKFNNIGGIVMNTSGYLYICDTDNNQIRVMGPDGKVALLAGSDAGLPGFQDGIGSAALFNHPRDIALTNSGDLIVADTANHAVRLIRTDGRVYTLAGNGSAGNYYGNRINGNACFSSPSSVCVDKNGNIYVADAGNYVIKLLNSIGLYHFCGKGQYGDTIGTQFTTEFHDMAYVRMDKAGNIYMLDYDFVSEATSRLLKINKNGLVGIVVDFDGSRDKYIRGLAINQSEELFVTLSDVVRLFVGDGDSITAPEDLRYIVGYTSDNGTAEVTIGGVTFIIGADTYVRGRSVRAVATEYKVATSCAPDDWHIFTGDEEVTGVCGGFSYTITCVDGTFFFLLEAGAYYYGGDYEPVIPDFQLESSSMDDTLFATGFSTHPEANGCYTISGSYNGAPVWQNAAGIYMAYTNGNQYITIGPGIFNDFWYLKTNPNPVGAFDEGFVFLDCEPIAATGFTTDAACNGCYRPYSYVGNTAVYANDNGRYLYLNGWTTGYTTIGTVAGEYGVGNVVYYCNGNSGLIFNPISSSWTYRPTGDPEVDAETVYGCEDIESSTSDEFSSLGISSESSST